MANSYLTHIGDEEYYEILSEIGYPVVPEEALEYTKEQIIDYALAPAVREYWSWFPILQTSSISVSGSNFSIDFPTLDNDNWQVIGVADARLTQLQYGNGDTGSVFLNALYTQIRYGGRYGTSYDYGTVASNFDDGVYYRTRMNTVRALRLHVDWNNRVVTGFANTAGEIITTWAIASTDFDDIPVTRRTEVIDYCKSKVLTLFGQLRSQINFNNNTEFNGSTFSDRAKALGDRVIKKWREFSKVTIIKS